VDQLPQQLALVTRIVRCDVSRDFRIGTKIEQKSTGWWPWFAILTRVSNTDFLREEVERHVTAPNMVWSVNPE
jgi:hypothetical protein